MTVTIVTPWYNHRELERDYWAAMRAAGNPPVIVVDNGSEPALPNAYRLDANLGFSRACNIGLELAATDAVVFLNNDIAATEWTWYHNLCCAIEPGVLVGAELRTDPHGDIDGVPLPYLDGWCLGGMVDDLRDLGGFDESFREPSYYGDNDLCLRARANGMGLREVRVGLHHKRNQTSHGTQNPAVVAATLANRERYAARVRELLVSYT